MLVLKRKEYETIHIGKDVKITFLKGTAKVGIDAPKDVKILRGELKEEE